MFYERFLLLCQKKRVKPTAVAAAIGISRTNASFWKNGSVPSSKNMRKLAEYFDVPVTYLMCSDNGSQNARDDATDSEPSSEIQAHRMLLGGILDALDNAPSTIRDAATMELSHVVQYVFHKYDMIPNTNADGAARVP